MDRIFTELQSFPNHVSHGALQFILVFFVPGLRRILLLSNFFMKKSFRFASDAQHIIMTHTSHPFFHFTPPQYWLNDPNGMVFFDGEWHLFYQHNPFGMDWGHMSWGHAISRDLVHWEHLPTALPEQPEFMIFSGSAVVDWANTSGLGDGIIPPLIAAYTAHGTVEQAQHIAFSTDRGRTWMDYAANPVIALAQKDFRDPKIFWHAPTQHWVMAVALPLQKQVRFYGSPDLRAWTRLSDFGPSGVADGAWECPDFFPLHIDGDVEQIKWVLKVDNGLSTGSASGGQYFIGDFDGATFACDDPPERVRPLDFGADFYAAQSWSDAPDNRRVWLAWMSHWAYAAKTPAAGWRGMMTLPREVALRTFADGPHLVQQPVRELQALRGEHHCIANVSSAEANAWLTAQGVSGAALEIDIAFAPHSHACGEFGVRVRVGADEKTVIGYAPRQQQLFVDRSRAGDSSFSPGFDARLATTVPLRNGTLKLHVFVDACSVEVFAGDGRVVMSDLIFPKDDSTGVVVFGDARVQSLDLWLLSL